MFQYFLLAIALLIGFLLIKYYLNPLRKLNHYHRMLTGLGFKVVKYPVSLFPARITSAIQQYKKYGDSFYTYKHYEETPDVVIYSAFNYICVELINPDLIRQLFLPQNFYVFPINNTLTKPLIDTFGEGLIFSNGKTWKNKRKTITSVFNFEFLKTLIPTMIATCDEQLAKLQNDSLNRHKKQGQPIQCGLQNFFSNTFATILVKGFFGGALANEKINDKPLSEVMKQLVTDLGSQRYSLKFFFFGSKILNLGLTQNDRKMNKIRETTRKIMSQGIMKRIQQIKMKKEIGVPSDFVQAIFKNNLFDQKETQNNEKYCIKTLIEQFNILYIAGTDTSSRMLQMLIYYLIKNPDALKKVRQQIAQFIKGQQDYTFQNLKKMKYIECTQNQTARMYGPATSIFFRQTSQDTFIGKLPIHKKTLVTISSIANHYNRKNYKDPNVFRPERWDDQTKHSHPYSFTGFGGGPKHCIGKHLAYLETKITLIRILKRYQNLEIPKQNFKMNLEWIYQPEKMLTKLYK